MTCSYTECFVPPERHSRCAAAPIDRCWGPLGHQHIPRRSQLGRRAEVLLCNAHHGSVDQGLRYRGRRLGNRIETEPGDPEDARTYIIFDRDTKETLVSVRLE